MEACLHDTLDGSNEKVKKPKSENDDLTRNHDVDMLRQRLEGILAFASNSEESSLEELKVTVSQ
jgi:hypothetical protein